MSSVRLGTAGIVGASTNYTTMASRKQSLVNREKHGYISLKAGTQLSGYDTYTPDFKEEQEIKMESAPKELGPVMVPPKTAGGTDRNFDWPNRQ